MKIILGVCVFVISFSSFASQNTALGRSNSLLRFIAKHSVIRDLALSTVLGLRCDRYALTYKTQCNDSVDAMIELLDYEVLLTKDQTPQLIDVDMPESFVFVAFKKNLISLLSDSTTETYLQKLQEGLTQYASSHDPAKAINLWDFTVKFYQTEAQAAKVLAAFFQDISRLKLHLAYLDRAQIRGNVSFGNNKERLSHVIDTINMLLDYNENDFGKIFYPKEIQSRLNRSIYHFYVPLFLSKNLAITLKNKIFAMSAPLMLTLTYEFITAAEDYSYMVYDPANITDLWKLRDIYGGYLGGMYGVNAAEKALAFEVVQRNFNASTKSGVQNLLRYSVTP
jgi:hypothetical protein